jgi:uncharacterized protein YjiS (DUF1127 family)
MTQIDLTRFPQSPVLSFAGFRAMLSAPVTWYHTYQTRRALNALSDRELMDIGLTRGDIDTIKVSG